ncbi:hypothetical protein [Gillisia sp. CAL575]|uniref:hypothetical protein n=1 Tax=Gillisia sp. CAL575 TaxID=985255 RepID=UPI000555FE39|nr:hypothetical protein [Gillisia sp. CAL575]
MKFYYRLIKTQLIILTIIVSGCVNNKNDKTESITPTNKKIDSAPEIEISGSWELTNKANNTRLFLYDDNTWKMISTENENDTLTKKGKYTVAKDSAVFFRYFGSQHWPNKDTINDYKTSIGTFVLFLNEKGELKDNQEDYDQTYKKVN